MNFKFLKVCGDIDCYKREQLKDDGTYGTNVSFVGLRVKNEKWLNIFLMH